MTFRRRTAVVAALALAGCADLTAPAGGITRLEEHGAAPRVVENAPLPAPAAAPTPVPAPTPAPAPAGQAQQVRASHVLVAYQGATRANPQVTRNKDEAKKRLGALSGGEAARLVFCRLSIQQPNVLVLDEFGQISPDAPGQVAYMLANGQAKRRMNSPPAWANSCTTTNRRSPPRATMTPMRMERTRERL